MCFILKSWFNTLRSNRHTIFGVIKILRWNILKNYQINFILFLILDEPWREAFKYWHNLTFLKLRRGLFNYSNSTYRHICNHGCPCDFSLNHFTFFSINKHLPEFYLIFLHIKKNSYFLFFFNLSSNTFYIEKHIC